MGRERSRGVGDDTRDFIRLARQIEQRIRDGAPYKKVTIHRHGPREDLGGVMGFLNFKRDKISELIKLGYDFACQYNLATDSVLP